MIDYSIPNFQFLIGAFDCTDYLDEFSIALPLHEINQPLFWAGNFKVSFNRKAIAAGLTEADFSQFSSPGRWRPAQQQVKFRINGYDLPVLRIERYAYNPQTRQGEGTLHQITQAVSRDRPAIEIPAEQIASGSGAAIAVNWSIAALVDRLIFLAFSGATVLPGTVLGGQSGRFYGGMTTRDPIGDAQKLTGIFWQWLYVDNTETIRIVQPLPDSQPSILARTLNQCEIEPNIDNINFAASNVIVTGSYLEPAPPKCIESPEPINPNLDQKGRPKVQRTIEQKPFKEVFKGVESTSVTPTISEIKWVFYQYPDDLTWDSQLWQFIPASFLQELQGDKPLDNAPIDSPCQTVVVQQQPAGRVFKSLGTNTNLIVAFLEFQSERRRINYKPLGVILEQGTSANLVQATREVLTTKPVILGLEPHGGTINPKTGKPQCLEVAPVKEERQLLPEQPLETVPVRGIATVAPVGWTPIKPTDLVVDVGYLPSVGVANGLAAQIAKREQRRRDAINVQMPIPNEWLAAGCPPLPRVTIGPEDYQADGLIIAISQQEKTAVFSFAASPLIPGLFAIESKLESQWVPEVAVSLVSLAAGESIITLSVSPSSVPEGTPLTPTPDQLIDTEWVPEVAVSLSASLTPTPNQLIDTEWVPEVAIALNTAAGSYITLSVSPSSVPEGTPGVSTIYLSVSPSSVPEGTPGVSTIYLSVSPSSVLEGTPGVSTIYLSVSPSSVLEGT